MNSELSQACYDHICHWCRSKYCECECHDGEDDLDRDWWHQDDDTLEY